MAEQRSSLTTTLIKEACLNLSSFTPLRKDKPVRLRPTKDEGFYIKYLLSFHSFSLTALAIKLNVSTVDTHNVVFGHRRSQRIETEIARILGKKDWNAVVTEARQATGAINRKRSVG